MSPHSETYFPHSYRFTIEDWHKIEEMGLFSPETQAELIEGEIIEMGPIDSSCTEHVNQLNHLFNKRITSSEIVSVQNPVILNNYFEPQPDLTVLRHEPDFYSEKHPTPEDILLLIEVSDSTLVYDRNDKKWLYARCNILEYWVVNLKDDCIEVHLNPHAQDYALIHIMRRGEIITPSKLPHISLAVSDILG